MIYPALRYRRLTRGADTGRSTLAHNSHPTPPPYPVRLATETSLARNELSGSGKDKGSLRGLSEGHEPVSFAFSHIINVELFAQDRASHHRLVPINKGKHKDLVGQDGSGRSINVTVSQIFAVTSHQGITHVQ